MTITIDELKYVYENGLRIQFTTGDGARHSGVITEWDEADKDMYPAWVSAGRDEVTGWVGIGPKAASHRRIVSADFERPADVGGQVILAMLKRSHEHGDRLRLTMADGRVREGKVTRWVDHSRTPAYMGDAGLWFGVESSVDPRWRIVRAEVIGDWTVSKCEPTDGGWIEVTTLEQARALDGKTVEVDASRVTEGAWGIRKRHGQTVSCWVSGGVLFNRDCETMWGTGMRPVGLRLRVVEPSQPASVHVSKSRTPSPDQPAIAFDPTATFARPSSPSPRPRSAPTAREPGRNC